MRRSSRASHVRFRRAAGTRSRRRIMPLDACIEPAAWAPGNRADPALVHPCAVVARQRGGVWVRSSWRPPAAPVPRHRSPPRAAARGIARGGGGAVISLRMHRPGSRAWRQQMAWALTGPPRRVPRAAAAPRGPQLQQEQVDGHGRPPAGSLRQTWPTARTCLRSARRHLFSRAAPGFCSQRVGIVAAIRGLLLRCARVQPTIMTGGRVFARARASPCPGSQRALGRGLMTSLS